MWLAAANNEHTLVLSERWRERILIYHVSVCKLINSLYETVPQYCREILLVYALARTEVWRDNL